MLEVSAGVAIPARCRSAMRLRSVLGFAGIPPTRPMWLAEPDNPAARAADLQWMLGDDLLIAPVVIGAGCPSEGAVRQRRSLVRFA